ncbi:MAG: hypothetical protein NAG76_19010 [Candidatus Pristimantibacillus lignocellulolyticus]|uniref:Butirosin biosynthesis protein H N-terminal domain-containing protein n=1 Tax=Candidatus Pristimantibacillus lignocellulolyticus TaxID=2994561 RepID=A0A9J6ZCR3_9BACL|nr:MAG: hypothetical protein NAG76_19010 [Candidatus Pristimantibacillus lignocellulolyticus]
MYSNKIKPFDEFWMNCILNQMFSVACTIEPSYRYAAYLNSYQYFRWEAATDPLFRYPTIDSMYYLDYLYANEGKKQEFSLSNVVGPLDLYYFKDNDNYLQEIKELCRTKQIFSLNVDLYYWIPNSIAYEKFHWYHYSLFNGYDEKTSTYYVIDDNLDGYMEHGVPEERLVAAYENSEYCTNPNYKLPPILKYSIREEIPPYELSLEEVRYHAARLITEIQAFQIEGLWNIELDESRLNDYLTYSMVGLNIIANRHKANDSLIRSLHELLLISTSTYEMLLSQIQDIRNGWEHTKQLFIKASILRKLDQAQCYRLMKSLLSKEVILWENLLKQSH